MQLQASQYLCVTKKWLSKMPPGANNNKKVGIRGLGEIVGPKMRTLNRTGLPDVLAERPKCGCGCACERLQTQPPCWLLVRYELWLDYPLTTLRTHQV